jgi:hypothetical protein
MKNESRYRKKKLRKVTISGAKLEEFERQNEAVDKHLLLFV